MNWLKRLLRFLTGFDRQMWIGSVDRNKADEDEEANRAAYLGKRE